MMYLVLYCRGTENGDSFYGEVVDIIGLFTDRIDAVECAEKIGDRAVVRDIVPDYQYKVEKDPYGPISPDSGVFNVAWYLE